MMIQTVSGIQSGAAMAGTTKFIAWPLGRWVGRNQIAEMLPESKTMATRKASREFPAQVRAFMVKIAKRYDIGRRNRNPKRDDNPLHGTKRTRGTIGRRGVTSYMHSTPRAVESSSSGEEEAQAAPAPDSEDEESPTFYSYERSSAKFGTSNDIGGGDGGGDESVSVDALADQIVRLYVRS